MNLLSALCVAGAAGVTVVLVRQLTGRVAIAIAAGLVLFLTPIAWRIATHADAHALHVLLLAHRASRCSSAGSRGSGRDDGPARRAPIAGSSRPPSPTASPWRTTRWPSSPRRASACSCWRSSRGSSGGRGLVARCVGVGARGRGAALPRAAAAGRARSGRRSSTATRRPSTASRTSSSASSSAATLASPLRRPRAAARRPRRLRGRPARASSPRSCRSPRWRSSSGAGATRC